MVSSNQRRGENAGADRGKSACGHDIPGAVNHSGEPASRHDAPSAAHIDPGESAFSDDQCGAIVQSRESAGAEWRPRKPVHADAGRAADRRS